MTELNSSMASSKCVKNFVEQNHNDLPCFLLTRKLVRDPFSNPKLRLSIPISLYSRIFSYWQSGAGKFGSLNICRKELSLKILIDHRHMVNLNYELAYFGIFRTGFVGIIHAHR